MFMLVLLSYFLFSYRIVSIETSIRVLDKGVLPLEKNSVAIQFFLDIENEDKFNACKLRSRPRMCCLSDTEDIDCDAIKIYGDYNDILKPKYRDTILYVYPTILQHDQLGYCNFILEQRCGRRVTKRKAVKIPFDTRLKMKSHCLKRYTNGQRVATCDTLDQNSLNQCFPVNCDVKYSGCRPFFDTEKNKCVKAVECLTDPKQNLPDIVYMPKSNTCRDLSNPLTLADIYALSTGLGIVKESPKVEEIKITLQSNCSTISQNLLFLRDLMYGKLFPLKFNADYSGTCNTALCSILKCIVGLSLALLLFVVLVNLITRIYNKWRKGGFGNKHHGFKDTKESHKYKEFNRKLSKINDEVKDDLVKDVIVSDLPLELRDSVVEICDRIGNECRWKRKCRTGEIKMGDAGSQVNFEDRYCSDTSTTSDLNYEEKQKLLK